MRAKNTTKFITHMVTGEPEVPAKLDKGIIAFLMGCRSLPTEVPQPSRWGAVAFPPTTVSLSFKDRRREPLVWTLLDTLNEYTRVRRNYGRIMLL